MLLAGSRSQQAQPGLTSAARVSRPRLQHVIGEAPRSEKLLLLLLLLPSRATIASSCRILRSSSRAFWPARCWQII